MAVAVPHDVMEVLSRSKYDDNWLKLPGEPGAPDALPPALYKRVAAILEKIGLKWNRKLGRHVGTEPTVDVLDQVLITGEYVDEKRDFQAFYTPDPLAQRVCNSIDIREGMTVLEPSAGLGALAKWAKFLGGRVTCAELNPKSCDTLEKLGFHSVWRGVDFLNIKPQPGDEPSFDRIVMNPPFTRGQDAAHVLHALRFLAPGGRMVAIMSAAVTFRDGDYQRIREMATSIEPLPDRAFAESGTLVKTALVYFSAQVQPGKENA